MSKMLEEKEKLPISSKQETEKKTQEVVEVYQEPLADGLPEWNLEPPNILVRRVKR